MPVGHLTSVLLNQITTTTATLPTTAKITTNHTEFLSQINPIMSSHGFRAFGSGVHWTLCNLMTTRWSISYYIVIWTNERITHLKLIFPQNTSIDVSLINMGLEWNVPMSSYSSSGSLGFWWSIKWLIRGLSACWVIPNWGTKYPNAWSDRWSFGNFCGLL